MSCHHSYELCVSQVPIFAHLSNETQQLVFKKINHRYFSKNEMLYMEGDKLDSLYVVHKGRVRIYRLNDEGEEQLIRVLAHGNYTGELSIFNASTDSASYAQILEDAEICMISKESIYELMSTYPNIAISFIETFASRLSEIEDQTTHIALLNSREKLLTYIDTYREGNKLHLNISKKHIASYLSMKPETLARTFKKLEEEGLIKKINHKTYEILQKLT